jgi:DNA-binding NarL/FixJ family response regulator
VANFKIILANSNPIMLRYIRILVAGIPGLEIVGEASDGQGLLDVLKQSTPDLVIIDIFLPHIHGLEITKIIKTSYHQVKILIITKETDIEILFQALYYGADGYLLEEDTESTLFAAIEIINKGNHFISPIMLSHLTQIDIKYYFNRRGLIGPLSNRLSGREKEILALIGGGNSNQEISCLLNLSIKTIHNYRARIMKKLHCRHSTDLTRYAIQKLPLFL